MLQGNTKRYFPGSYAFLGKLSNKKYSEERVVIDRYVKEKDRWAVQLWRPEFSEEKIMVKEENLFFDCYAVPCSDVPKLPSHLSVEPTDKYDKPMNGMYVLQDWDADTIILEEDPLLIVANRGVDGSDFECRWNLYYGIEHDRGPTCPLLKAFNEMADGGDNVIKKYLGDAEIMFKNVLSSSGRSAEEIEDFCKKMPEFVEEEHLRISKVLSKWQSNSHNFPIFDDMDQSCLFRFTSKMQHSCEPNVVLNIDKQTGGLNARTLRRIQAGEELTNSYMGEDDVFNAMSVEERRAKLAHRGFTCLCVRCVRESGE